MNFGQLKATLLAEIGRPPSDVVYQLVTEDINRELRISEMVASATLTEAASVTLPTGFLGVISAYLDTDPRVALTPTTKTALDRSHRSGQTACEYAIEDGVMYLNPEPQTTETIVLTYYSRVPLFSADTDENEILTNYPSIYIYGALTHHAALKQDQTKAAMWKVAYDNALAGARKNDLKIKNGHTPIKVAVGTAP